MTIVDRAPAGVPVKQNGCGVLAAGRRHCVLVRDRNRFSQGLRPLLWRQERGSSRLKGPFEFEGAWWCRVAAGLVFSHTAGRVFGSYQSF